MFLTSEPSGTWLSVCLANSYQHLRPHFVCVCVCVCVRARVLARLIAQSVKNLPAMQETRLQFLGWEDPLEKEMATHFSIQYSWLENPMDGGAWWATVHGVQES